MSTSARTTGHADTQKVSAREREREREREGEREREREETSCSGVACIEWALNAQTWVVVSFVHKIAAP